MRVRACCKLCSAGGHPGKQSVARSVLTAYAINPPRQWVADRPSRHGHDAVLPPAYPSSGSRPNAPTQGAGW